MPFGVPPTPSSKKDSALTKEREDAWTGDAVLALFVRKWILNKYGKMDGEMFVRFTSNDFLKALGNPTSVEAEIGRCYDAKGLEASFEHIEQKLMPMFLLKEKNRLRQEAMKPKKKRKR